MRTMFLAVLSALCAVGFVYFLLAFLVAPTGLRFFGLLFFVFLMIYNSLSTVISAIREIDRKS